MKSILEKENYEELVNRIEQLEPDTQAQWGKMNVAQMMRHCQLPLEIPLGKTPPPKPNFIMKLMVPLFKKAMYSDKPWKPNMQTAPGFSIKDERDFETEKKQLLSLAEEFATQRDRDWGRHPVFGDFTNEQWGKMQYKHIDHHLRQFGV